MEVEEEKSVQEVKIFKHRLHECLHKYHDLTIDYWLLITDYWLLITEI